jgi:hypothetical protein
LHLFFKVSRKLDASDADGHHFWAKKGTVAEDAVTEWRSGVSLASDELADWVSAVEEEGHRFWGKKGSVV